MIQGGGRGRGRSTNRILGKYQKLYKKTNKKIKLRFKMSSNRLKFLKNCTFLMGGGGGRGGQISFNRIEPICLYLFRKEMKISCIFTTFSFLVSNNFTTYCLPPRHADLVLSPNSSDLWVRPSLCSSFHFTLSHLSDVKL